MVKLGQRVSRPGYQLGFLRQPHQIHLPSCCSVLSKGILTPPLLSKEARPDLNIGTACSPCSSLTCQPAFSLPKETLSFTPMSFLYQSITPVSSPPYSPPVMALILLTAALPYWLSGQTQRSPSPRALLQSEHIEPLCSHVLHPPYTARLHKHTHGLHLSPQLREKANETVLHLPVSAPVLTSSDCRSQKCATKILPSKYH